MYDIITFGSATLDIFLKPRGPKTIKDEKKFITGKGICFNLGSKIEVEEIHFSSGGSGTNTAATFVKQGFKTAYCGRIGDDSAGKEISDELKKLGIKTEFVFKTKKKLTNISVVLSGFEDDRTIFVYRGASEFLTKKDIPWQKIKTCKWFYLGPLSGQLCAIFEDIVDFAHKNKIKVMVNPGNCQLSFPIEKLKNILKRTDILLLNFEEASFLTKVPYNQEEKVFKKVDNICPGIAIMTKGPEGVTVSDGKYLYKADVLKTKVVDRTGAGDAFGSGFLSEYIRSNNIERAIQLGIANSSACLSQWGAKNGLIDKNSVYEKVRVKRERV